jgi:hypothetical protein
MMHGVFILPDGSAKQVPLKVDASGHLAISGFDDATDKLLFGTARERFFENFNTFDASAAGEWEVLQTGDGMAITGPLGGAAAGSGPYMNISSGVTAGSKTVILSRQSFNMPVDLRYQISASQRIANNHFIIGFVQVDDDGAIITDTSFSTEPEALNARNAAYHKHDGVTATSANLRVRAAGSALDTLANAFGTGFTTVATGTSPNFIAACIFGLTLERDRISARAYGQNVLTNTGGQFGYDRLLLNPTRKYKLVMIVENGAVAPASSTDWRIHMINLMDATRVDVSPRNGGNSDLAKAFGVNVLGGSLGSVTLAPSQTVIPTVTPTRFADTTTALGAGATFTGTSRDEGTTATFNEFAAQAFADQVGTLIIDNSTDNVAWVEVSRVAVAAGQGQQLSVPALARYHRVRYINGGVAQASFGVRSMYRRI